VKIFTFLLTTTISPNKTLPPTSDHSEMEATMAMVEMRGGLAKMELGEVVEKIWEREDDGGIGGGQGT
jgi:hypothetical protein